MYQQCNDVHPYKATYTEDVAWRYAVYCQKLDSANEGGGQVWRGSHKHSVNSHYLNLTE